MPELSHAPCIEPTLEDLVTTVSCPTCHVGVGACCTTRAGKPARNPHGTRFDAVEQAAGITQHRAEHHRKAEAKGTWKTDDRAAEQALLTDYASRINAPSTEPERTQPDEALRRARLDDNIRAGLRLIADRFRHVRPHVIVSEARRLAIALRTAEQLCKGPGPAADELERQLLMRMPHVDTPITRGEYALVLDRASWSAQ